MSRIRGKDTKPELVVRRALFALGYRYRIGHKLPGRPDLVFVHQRVAVFIDGCFWHRCPEHFRMPRSNREFWEAKISANCERDRRVDSELTELGWRVLRFWEHEVRREPDVVVGQIVMLLGGML
ncbi:Very-short-patch mismatch repair endonuclease (G-T specific) [Imhoffiella purpurea]|uniref:Very-short-patch mismatch repair endonuclease (G-T specific) n=2 Tax=Imhoffiella purpurea TaxID=1249627 RepID=W9VT66_9GAMM|nr:Very-short-patch mismatch repair endonuclease (G-T specific) [Imhoffiella purpurea]